MRAECLDSMRLRRYLAGADSLPHGSRRAWAARGTQLLGVRVVNARSFERIHRSNLVGMGILPCELQNGVIVESFALEDTGKNTGWPVYLSRNRAISVSRSTFGYQSKVALKGVRSH
jgi:3-isopropylmalate dehydratase small subunit